jgi:8-oxo-dGTP pyrophosphatase MutT (NUDIX family)
MALRRYEAAGGVIVHHGKMLLLERTARDEMRLPKGHIEEGETAQAAALRETSEETGYADLEIVADLGTMVVEFDYRKHHCVRTESYYLIGLRSERQVARNAKDAAQFRLCWVSMQDAAATLTFEDEQEFARRAVIAFSSPD